jgi:hypothetical protein
MTNKTPDFVSVLETMSHNELFKTHCCSLKQQLVDSHVAALRHILILCQPLH